MSLRTALQPSGFEHNKTSLPTARYLAAAAAVSAVSAVAARETKGVDLADIDLADDTARKLTPGAYQPELAEGVA